MGGFIRKFTKQIIILCNVLVSICMLLLYLLPGSNQLNFWFVNILALVFPFLIFVQLGFLIFWLMAKRKLALIPLITLVLCWPFINVLVGTTGKIKLPAANTFKAASWNVHLFNFYENNANLDAQMLQSAKDLNADVLAVQELVFSIDSTSDISLDNVRRKLGYQYAVAGNDRKFGVHTNAGKRNEHYFAFSLALFSKHPILQWQKVQPLREYNHTFIWADIKIGKDTIRFFNVHLQSMHFAKQDYDFIEAIDNTDMAEVKKSGKNLLSKMKNANILRSIQINAVKEEVLKSPHPVILCGDFNDVPNSYAYQTMKDILNDAFVKKGYGLGRSFLKLSPTLRIDYIFHDKKLKPVYFQTVQKTKSDHRPLTADFLMYE
jgi:endonuclease/exonuclease/phosphatase family metal-dependent hydrolase